MNVLLTINKGEDMGLEVLKVLNDTASRFEEAKIQWYGVKGKEENKNIDKDIAAIIAVKLNEMRSAGKEPNDEEIKATNKYAKKTVCNPFEEYRTKDKLGKEFKALIKAYFTERLNPQIVRDGLAQHPIALKKFDKVWNKLEAKLEAELKAKLKAKL
jgi:hypothetical protein